MTHQKKIGVVILAAGESKRLGQPKQLLKYNDQPLLQHTINLVNGLSCTPKVMVLGAFIPEIKREIDPFDITICCNKYWKEGISSSIKAGLNTCLELNPEMESVLFLVGDQPFLTGEFLIELISMHKARKSTLTGSEYKQEVGVPALFDRCYFREILALDGNNGAKKVIRNHSKKVVPMKFEMGYFDVDTLEDYKRLLKTLAH